jgi:hypothetical protein
VVTVIIPVVAEAGTVAVIWFKETTVNAASTPLNFSEVPAPTAKLSPEMVTKLPATPLVGVKEVKIGCPLPDKTLRFTTGEIPTAFSLSVAFAVRTWTPLTVGVHTIE